MAGSRHPLRALGACLPAIGLAAVAALAGLAGCANPASSPVTEAPVTRALAIPPWRRATVSGGQRTYALDVQAGTTDFGVGGPTDTYGVNQSYLGPTLRMTTGDDVRMEVHNDLDTATTLHWHGMHVPAKMDGGPHQLLDPGQTWSPAWRVRQPAATLWYHAHPHGHDRRPGVQGRRGDDPGRGPDRRPGPARRVRRR